MDNKKFPAGRDLNQIDYYRRVIQCALFCDRTTKYNRNLGVGSYFKSFGVWPVIRIIDYSHGDNGETFFYRYMNRAEYISGLYSPYLVDFQDRVNGHFDFFCIRPPTKSFDFGYVPLNIFRDLALKCINKKNYMSLTQISERLEVLDRKRVNWIDSRLVLNLLNKSRRLTNKGVNEMGDGEILEDKIKKTTDGVRSAVIDELNLLRQGKTTIGRARVVSSLAARALESMRLDIEAQFMMLKDEINTLESLPYNKIDEVQ